MSINEIKKNLVAFKGNMFLYANPNRENDDNDFLVKILSVNELELIDENPDVFNY